MVNLDHREYSVAAVRALNHAIDKTRTAAVRKLQETYNVKYGVLRNKAFAVRRATRQTLTAFLGATGRPLPLYWFSARENRKGVSVSVRKGRGRKTISGAFIARMPSGHVGVFMRDPARRHIASRIEKYGKQTKHSEGIAEKFTISVPGMMLAKDIDDALREVAVGSFIAEMTRQGNLIIGRRNG